MIKILISSLILHSEGFPAANLIFVEESRPTRKKMSAALPRTAPLEITSNQRDGIRPSSFSDRPMHVGRVDLL